MPEVKEQQHFHILKIINQSHDIVGSGSICQSLRQCGVDLSEATVGRILRELDRKGFTLRDGFKGRALTEAGIRRLESLSRAQNLRDKGSHLLAVLSATGEKDLLDVLVARKAMERELARLAAGLISEAEIKALSDLVDRHLDLTESGGVGAMEDVEFHSIIAVASGNRVLQAAMELVRHDHQFSPLLHYIRQQLKSTVVFDHIRILHFLRQRDPDQAEQAMVLHLDNLIHDVKMYWAQYHSQVRND